MQIKPLPSSLKWLYNEILNSIILYLHACVHVTLFGVLNAVKNIFFHLISALFVNFVSLARKLWHVLSGGGSGRGTLGPISGQLDSL